MEEACTFGDNEGLVGVLSLPDAAPHAGSNGTRPLVVALNAGLVHRVGPQRLHVRLLRRLAQEGFCGLRFDFSSIGDSLPRQDTLPYTTATLAELSQALDAAAQRTGASRFVVLGLSSGALVSMAAAGADSRVAGVCMLNPHGFGIGSVWGEHVEALAAGREYTRNLTSLRSWGRLFTGRSDYRRLGRTLRQRLLGAPGRREAVEELASQARPQLGDFFERGLPTLLVFSEKDSSRDNFDQILGTGWAARLASSVEVVQIADANHTFASPIQLELAMDAISRWLHRHWPADLTATGSQHAAGGARIAASAAASGDRHGI